MKYFITVINLLLLLSSCNNVQKQPSIEERENALQDSINTIIQKEREVFVNDSIDHLKIKTYKVKYISGKSKSRGYTKLSYTSVFDLIKDTKDLAKKQMWANEKLDKYIAYFKSEAIGGQLKLEISRLTLGTADTKYFTVILKDLNENELYRDISNLNSPNYSSSSDDWWSLELYTIPIKLEFPIYVYIIDEFADAPFKFEITPEYK